MPTHWSPLPSHPCYHPSAPRAPACSAPPLPCGEYHGNGGVLLACDEAKQHDELDGNNFPKNVAINLGLAFAESMASDNYLEADLDSAFNESMDSDNKPEVVVGPLVNDSRAGNNQPEVLSTPLVTCSLCGVKIKAFNLQNHEAKCLGVGTLDCPKCRRAIGIYGFEQHVMECRPISRRRKKILKRLRDDSTPSIVALFPPAAPLLVHERELAFPGLDAPASELHARPPFRTPSYGWWG